MRARGGPVRAYVMLSPGCGHATGIFESHPAVIEEIADWLASRLAP